MPEDCTSWQVTGATCPDHQRTLSVDGYGHCGPIAPKPFWEQIPACGVVTAGEKERKEGCMPAHKGVMYLTAMCTLR